MKECTKIFLVDFIQVPICKNARIKSKNYKDKYETVLDRVCSAVTKSYFYGYKLNCAISFGGIYSSMELTKANSYDIQFLNVVKPSGIENFTLFADNAYVPESSQRELTATSHISVLYPVKHIQHDKESITFIYIKSRKRYESFFSQLCDQLMLIINYAIELTAFQYASSIKSLLQRGYST